MAELVRKGMSLDDWIWQDLADIAAQLNNRRSNKVSVSEAGREVIPLGTDAWQVMEQYRTRPMHRRDRAGMVRQALHDFEAESTDAEDILVERLADVAGVDADELRIKLLELKTDG